MPLHISGHVYPEKKSQEEELCSPMKFQAGAIFVARKHLPRKQLVRRRRVLNHSSLVLKLTAQACSLNTVDHIVEHIH